MRIRKTKKTNTVEKNFQVRSYCTMCGKRLMESRPMTKKEMMGHWDEIVMGSTCMPCEVCGTKVPNFRVEIKIYHIGLDKEFAPKDYLPDTEFGTAIEDKPQLPEVPPIEEA